MATRHLDAITDYNDSEIVTISYLAECGDDCNPGNCEAAHREAMGWAAVEGQ